MPLSNATDSPARTAGRFHTEAVTDARRDNVKRSDKSIASGEDSDGGIPADSTSTPAAQTRNGSVRIVE